MPIDNSSRFPKPLAADLRELSEGMAIVIDGDTAPKAIASGQYLFIKNHSTLATGGYHATAAIASGADITSSNVTPDADGIVNGAFSSLSEQIAMVQLCNQFISHATTSETALSVSEDVRNFKLLIVNIRQSNEYMRGTAVLVRESSGNYANAIIPLGITGDSKTVILKFIGMTVTNGSGMDIDVRIYGYR